MSFTLERVQLRTVKKKKTVQQKETSKLNYFIFTIPLSLSQHPEMSLVLLRRWKRVSAGSKPCSLAPNRAQLGVLAV